MTIFVSYSRANEDAVKTLARAFEEARREVWLDRELDGGDVWWATILENIRKCSVFVLALSDDSLASKACMAEYGYAEALDRPIVPVKVGHVSDLQASPLGDIHYVTFHDDFTTGAAVLAAVDRKAARKVPLPDPRPAEPPIPLGYLKAIRRQIDTSEPNLETQLQIVEQLRRGIGEEPKPKVRAEIKSTLIALMTKPWRAQQTEFEIEIVLSAIAKMEDRIARLSGGGPDGSPVESGRGEEDPSQAEPEFDPEAEFMERFGIRSETAGSIPSSGTAGSTPSSGTAGSTRSSGTGWSTPSSDTGSSTRSSEADVGWSAPSSKEIFEQRVEEIYRQMQGGAAVREAARGTPQAEPDPTTQASPWPGPSQGEPRIAEKEPEPTTTVIEPPPGPPGAPRRPRSSERSQGSAGTTPTRRALGVTGLILAVVGGVVAPTTGFVPLVVPFVIAVAAAVVALRFSAQVGRRGSAGDVDGAGRASHTAMVWSVVALTLVGAVVGLVALVMLS
jgi:hypothetical protein